MSQRASTKLSAASVATRFISPLVLAIVAACSAGDDGSDPSSNTPSGASLYGTSLGQVEGQEGGGISWNPNGSAPPEPAYTHCPSGKWCSSLYPPSWSPELAADSAGRFLHDFSYAGYHTGETPPVDDNQGRAIHDVVSSGADPTGARDSTVAIQKAIDLASSAGGGVVFFPAGTYRIDDNLAIKASRVVLRGTGRSSVLRFTKQRGMAYLPHVSIGGAVTRDAPRPLAIDASERSKEIFVADVTGLAPGDDVAVGWTITPAFVAEHEMTATWTAFNGKHVPFFRSKIVSIDSSVTPARVVLDVPLRYAAKIRDGASLQKETGYVTEVGVEHLAVNDATTKEAAWAESQVNVLTLHDVNDAWVVDVHSVALPNIGDGLAKDGAAAHLRSGGIRIENSKRVSVLSTSMQNPENRGSGGNGYLFELSRTNEVLFADCEGRNGRHNFIQNWGFGNSGTVFLRCTSVGSEMLSLIRGALTPEPALSEHHHSLAMATLVDSCRLDDGFGFENRGSYSEGAGHTGTSSVVWNTSGSGVVKSKQFGWGYVIGTGPTIRLDTDIATPTGAGTSPEDFVEGAGQADTLFPPSLYEDQRLRRRSREP